MRSLFGALDFALIIEILGCFLPVLPLLFCAPRLAIYSSVFRYAPWFLYGRFGNDSAFAFRPDVRAVR